MMAADPMRHRLGQLLRAVEPSSAAVELGGHVDIGPLVVDAERQPVLVLRDPVRHEWQQEIGSSLVRLRPDVVVVDVGYPAWRPEGAAGYVTTFGAARVNLEAAAEALLAAAAV
jgi:beta-N-acetylhexosaminidase